MEVQFRRSVVSGRLKAPPSPAASHRALIAAMLAPGPSVISNISQSPGVMATLSACRELGADIVARGDAADISGPSDLVFPPKIDCGDSNATLKLLLPIAAMSDSQVQFTGGHELSVRPLAPYSQYLGRLGADVSSSNGFVPLTVRGPITETQLVYFPPLGTQFLSGMLLGAPLRLLETQIGIEGEFSDRQPIEETLAIMKKCGIRIDIQEQDMLYISGCQGYSALSDFEVPGSLYLSSFILLAAALSGRVTVEGVPASPQLEGLFKSFGAEAKSVDGSFFVSAGPLEGTELDAALLGRHMLHAVALGSIAHGETRISNIAANSRRNADRVRLLIRVLSRMGANINESEHSLIISGGRLTGAEIDCEGDPYVAMAASAAALSADGPTHLKGAECATSAYPGFFSGLSGIGAIAREMQKLR